MNSKKAPHWQQTAVELVQQMLVDKHRNSRYRERANEEMGKESLLTQQRKGNPPC